MSVAFSPDRKLIVTESDDGTTLIYYTHIEDLIAPAKTRITRGLTCEERDQYLHDEKVCLTPTPGP